MKIGFMQEKQLHALADIEKACFGAPWSEEGLREELENPHALFLVAEGSNGTVYGYIGCQVVLDEGYITNVAVSPAHRRKGVARQLIDTLLYHGSQRKLKFITLEARASNLPAITLYKARGFKPVGMRKNYYAAPREDAILMTYYFEEECTQNETEVCRQKQ